MTENDRETDHYTEQRKIIAAEEAAKEFLLDKSIGAPHPVLRPDDNFIEFHVGKPRTQDEIDRETAAAAKQAFDAERTAEERQREIQISIARHNAALRERAPENDAQAQTPPENDNSNEAHQQRESLRDYMIRQRERKHAHGRSR